MLTVSSLNGKMRRINGLASAQTPGVRIPPDYAPWWKQVKPPGFNTRTRRNLEPGQLFKDAGEYFAPWPYTPSMDARDLPEAFTGKPLKQLPHRQFTVDFPHTYIDYSQLYPAVGPEMGQQPSGWEPMPVLGQQKQEALRAAMPAPWAAPENMAYDISGLSGFLGMLGQLGQSGEFDTSSLVLNLSDTAKDEGAKAAAAGAEPSAVEKIISSVVEFGSTAASLYMQKRAADKLQNAEERAKRQAALAAQAQANLPADIATRDFGAPTPWYKSPIFIIGAVLIGGVVAYLVVRSMR